MTEDRSLLATLDRVFAGPRESPLTVAAFLEGLETRSYPFIVAALALPNCIPTGIPLIYELDDSLIPVRHYYLGDPDEVAKRVAAVSSQGKAKP